MKKSILLSILFLFYIQIISAQITANFTANTTSGCPNPTLIILSDLSISSQTITSWNWQLTGPIGFTPINSATNQLSASLSIPGFYTVTLTVCNNTGACDTKTEVNYIEIFQKPSYSYSITPASGCAPQQVCFDGTINPGCGTITNILFDVNDGTVYNTADFCHTYNNAGTYSGFVVSIQNSCGCVITETLSNSINLINGPIANFTANNTFSCTPPLNVNFTNTSTASAAASYSWNIPGLVTNATTTNLSQSFTAGNYDVQLIVSEPNGCADTLLRPNFIGVGNPIADFTANSTSICAGGSVQFTNQSIGSPVSYAWQVIGQALSSTQQNPTFTFANAGTYSVQLTTTYAGGCQDVELKNNYITVHPKPTNSFTVSDNSSCAIPFTTTYQATSTNSVGTFWNFPGGTPATYSGAGPVNVTYNVFANFNITMTDTSAQGCTKQTVFNNVVNIAPITATLIADTTEGCIPVTSNLSFTTNVSDSIVSSIWTLPGSNIGSSSLATPTAIYNNVGCNDVILSLATLSGCSATLTNNSMICAGNPPIANFTFTPPSTCFEVDDVCFTFTGSGADTLLWNFGEGPLMWASPNTSPCHSYNTDIGSYTPSLIAYSYGCPSDTVVFLDSIDILGPVASFTSVFDGCVNWNRINFTNTSAEADSSYWVFGDPTVGGNDTSTLTSPFWIYPAIDSVKTYSVTLNVYNDSTGCTHTTSNTITVFPPSATFTISDTVGCAPLTISLQNTSISTGPTIWFTRWNWDETYYFGTSGANINTVWNNGPTRTKTYNTPGVYSIIMRNLDSRSCLDTIARFDVLTVHGINTDFSADVTEGCFPLTVNFTDLSVAPITYVASWHWDFGTGNPADTSNLQNPTFIFTEGGLYTITLTATDSFGCVKTKTVNQYIYVHDPIANFTMSDTFICSNQSLNLTNTSSGDTLSYNWQFQNADILSYTTNGNPPMLTYAVEGTHNLFLEVTDNLGCTDDTTRQIQVYDVVANGTASANYSSCSNPPLFVNFSNTSLNNVDSSTVLWNFGNGNTSTFYNPSTLYSSPGEFIVTLTIGSNTGCYDTTVIDTIVVEGPWGEFSAISSPETCHCDSVSFEIKTINATTPVFLTGDGQAVPFFPLLSLPGDTIRDTLTIQYCGLGNFIPSLSFSEGSCSYFVQSSDTVKIDSLTTHFNFSNAILCDSGSICFTDSSYNAINGFNALSNWFWDFGTGNPTDTSTIQNPCFFYTSPGIYNVCLTVESENGCVKTQCDSVTIRQSPNVSFGQSDIGICVNNNVQFYDSTITYFSANINTWSWNFGTGNPIDTATSQNPNFTYANPDIVNISLQVVDNFGCTNSDTSQVEVYNPPFIASSNDTTICLGDTTQLFVTGGLTYIWSPNTYLSDDTLSNPLVFPVTQTMFTVNIIDTNGCSAIDSVLISVNEIYANFTNNTACAGDIVNFTDLSTSSSGIINQWNWQFSDIASGINDSSSIQNPAHTFNASGNYVVNLSIENNFGCSADTLINVSISILPEAIIIFDSACVNTPISFSGTSSTGGSGSIIQYSWDFGTVNNADTSNLVSPTFTYTTPGLYTVCLTVTNDLTCAGNAHDTCVQVLIYAAPIANQQIDTVCLGTNTAFNDISIAGSSNIVSHFWSFGQMVSDTAFITSSIGDTSFTYSNFGNYTVIHTIIDENNCTHTSSSQAIVYDNPLANFNANTVCLGQSNVFNSTSQIGLDSINAITSYYWDFDEGANFNLSGNSPSYTFANTGNHNISLAIVDAFGCTDTISQILNILNNPTAIITVTDAEICEGESTTVNALSSVFGTPTAQYAWDFNYNTGIDNTTPTFTILPNANATIMLIVTDANTCSDTAFQQIVVNELPTANFTQQAACINLPSLFNSTILEGDTTIQSLNWFINGANAGNSQNLTYTPTILNDFTIQLSATDFNNCTDFSPIITISVDDTTSTTLLNNDSILCSATILDLAVIGNAFRYEWTPSYIVDNANANNVTANIQESTTIYVTGFSENEACPPSNDTISFYILEEPSINYEVETNPVFVGLSTEISLDIVPFDENIDSVVWAYNETLNSTFGVNNLATPMAETNYPFTVYYSLDSVTCAIDSFVNIQIIDECSNELIYAPNVFTPNNDSKNDYFIISGLSVDHLNYLRIFDRWGKLVFEKQNLDFKNGKMKIEDAWNGNNLNGNYCNNGVYVFMYEGVCLNNDAIIGSGNITLIR